MFCFIDLSDILVHYETLHHTHLNHVRTKRSTDNTDIKEVQINTLGR